MSVTQTIYQLALQVVESYLPHMQDAPTGDVAYYSCMTCVYVADAKTEERSALRNMLISLAMEVVGEAADWPTTLLEVPKNGTDMLLIDWELLPSSPNLALDILRKASPRALLIVLISHLDARQQAALSAGADAFISKDESPDRVVARLREMAAIVRM